MKNKNYIIILLLIFPLTFMGQNIQDIWISGEPPIDAKAKVKPSGMQHYYAYRNRGKEKLLLWPRNGNTLNKANYCLETKDTNIALIVKGPDRQTLKSKLINSDLGWHIEYDFVKEGFHNIFMIFRENRNDTAFVHIAQQERMSHKCRSGHKSVMVRMDANSYPEITALELIRKRQDYENFHGILESGMTLEYSLLFNGKSLANHPVKIVTQSDWTLNIMSDDDGIISFQLPNDYFAKFKEIDKHKTHRFTIETTYVSNNLATDSSSSITHYSTKMEFDYIPSKTLYQSYVWPWVLFFTSLIALSIGIIVIRRRKRHKYIY